MTARKYKAGDNAKARGKAPNPRAVPAAFGDHGPLESHQRDWKSPLKPFMHRQSAEERDAPRPAWMNDPALLPKSPPKKRAAQ